MDLVKSVAVLYALIMFVFAIGFLINWYRNREVISQYKRIGFWAGVIYVIFQLVLLGLSHTFPYAACLTIFAIGLDMLGTWGFVNSGIFFSNQLNIRSFPLVAPRLGLPPAPTPAPVEVPAIDPSTVPAAEEATPSADTSTESEVVSPEPIEPVATVEPVAAIATPLEPEPIAPPPINWPRYWLNILGVTMGGVIYSAVLFIITQPRPGAIVQNLQLSDEPIITPVTLVVLLGVAFTEELMFRLGIQNYLGAKLINKRYGYAIAVTLTAALWSVAHVGSLNPDWVKLAQIFPIGLALGWLYRRQGTESTIMAHALFNLVGGFVLPSLYLR